jgi:hypothetical protein
VTRSTIRRVVLIGAARSGTKALRDAIAEATGAGRVPFDIGYVWRDGVPPSSDDVLDPTSLTPTTASAIRSFIDRYATGDPPAVIEKTVANAVRVPFVAAVLPDAHLVHLVRDGVDVAESTLRQWQAPTEFRYLLAKVRHFPLRLAPSYGRRYLLSLLRRRVRPDRRVASWGPRYPGMDGDLVERGLLVVCARQWRESVVRAQRDLAQTGRPVVEVRYEEFVADPRRILAGVAEACGLTTTPERLRAAGNRVRAGSTGEGRRALSPDEMAVVQAEIGDLLAELGYQCPSLEGGSR